MHGYVNGLCARDEFCLCGHGAEESANMLIPKGLYLFFLELHQSHQCVHTPERQGSGLFSLSNLTRRSEGFGSYTCSVPYCSSSNKRNKPERKPEFIGGMWKSFGWE